MADIAFMSVDPDNEISDREESEDCDDSRDDVDVRVPKMKEV